MPSIADEVDTLRTCAVQYYHHALAFPQYVSAAHAGRSDHDAAGRDTVLGTARRCRDARWGFPDGVQARTVAAEAAG